ncbi:MAG: CHAP domain-containing protein [Acetobacteraceae bacterium]|nr:CHAP domain-containing protein [Acetobacteraceae bacterium]
MAGKRTSGGLILFGSLVAFGFTFSNTAANAESRQSDAIGSDYGAHLPVALYANAHPSPRRGVRTVRASGGRLQCVPYARNVSGIEIVGNAFTWWDSAAGVYQRGSAPESGAVLAFRASRTMRLGHVAVVSRVLNGREIEIQHANWGPGISRDVRVVDVSPANDWTAVRVALARESDTFGSVYRTHGFIYDRPDRGAMVAAKEPPAPVPDVKTAPAERVAAERVPAPIVMSYDGSFEEVAEAPQPARRRHARPH